MTCKREPEQVNKANLQTRAGEVAQSKLADKKRNHKHPEWQGGEKYQDGGVVAQNTVSMTKKKKDPNQEPYGRAQNSKTNGKTHTLQGN